MNPLGNAVRAVALVVLASAAVGCESPSGPQGVRIRTESAAYALGTPIGYTVFNLRTTPVYLAQCCGIAAALDRWRGGRWVSYRSAACLAVCPMAAFELGSGQTLAGVASVADTGRYRLLIGIATDRLQQPDWSRASNAFDVR